MNELLQDIVGQRVRIWSLSAEQERADEGILEAFDDRWLRIRQNDELLFFPIYNIRLVKPVR